MSDSILEIDHLSAGYGDALVIEDISFALADGAALALIGRNGAGKTTLLRTIMGLTRRRSGEIMFARQDISTRSSERRAAAGLGWVPQERNIFRSLTVEENITAVARPGIWTLRKLYGLFPRLEERKNQGGSQLSGGEQQMLALARALALNPKVLLLDEPLEGLAPIIVDDVLRAIVAVGREGIATIIVEQSPRKILPITGSALILNRGKIAFSGSSRALEENPALVGTLLGVGAAEPLPA